MYLTKGGYYLRTFALISYEQVCLIKSYVTFQEYELLMHITVLRAYLSFYVCSSYVV